MIEAARSFNMTWFHRTIASFAHVLPTCILWLLTCPDNQTISTFWNRATIFWKNKGRPGDNWKAREWKSLLTLYTVLNNQKHTCCKYVQFKRSKELLSLKDNANFIPSLANHMPICQLQSWNFLHHVKWNQCKAEAFRNCTMVFQGNL